jgi:hypothetical protein
MSGSKVGEMLLVGEKLIIYCPDAALFIAASLFLIGPKR